jgi:hypothetical protein
MVSSMVRKSRATIHGHPNTFYTVKKMEFRWRKSEKRNERDVERALGGRGTFLSRAGLGHTHHNFKILKLKLHRRILKLKLNWIEFF